MRSNSATQLFDLLRKTGKVGALAFLCAAGGVGWYGAEVLEMTAAGEAPGGASIKYFAFAFTLGLVGVGLLFAPRPYDDPRFRPVPPAELAAKVLTTARPFYVCVDCRVLLPLEAAMGRCPRCNSASACMEVSTEDDVKMVRAALGEG